MQIPSIVLKDDHFFLTQTLSNLTYQSLHIDDAIQIISNEKRLKISECKKSNRSLFDKQEHKIPSIFEKQQTQIFTNTIFDVYIPFINRMISQGTKYIGKIQSYVQGDRNNNKLFFNITGGYRFCPKKGTHHERNGTAIIIDISHDTYAIRCKDPCCDNSFLTWHHIDK
ncbi:unnamed protein product [Rotaria sp. Silwood2]|nr:unnamed protein product [Rotaria sp. Silwood2]